MVSKAYVLRHLEPTLSSCKYDECLIVLWNNCWACLCTLQISKQAFEQYDHSSVGVCRHIFGFNCEMCDYGLALRGQFDQMGTKVCSIPVGYFLFSMSSANWHLHINGISQQLLPFCRRIRIHVFLLNIAQCLSTNTTALARIRHILSQLRYC